MKALGALQEKSAIPILKQYLNSKDADPAVRAAALGALGTIDAAAAQPFATAALDSSNAALQKEAVTILGAVLAGAGGDGASLPRQETGRTRSCRRWPTPFADTPTRVLNTLDSSATSCGAVCSWHPTPRNARTLTPW